MAGVVQKLVGGKNMKNMKKFKTIIRVIFFIPFIIFFITGIIKQEKDYKEFLNERYKGVITDIREIEGSRGIPEIKINNEWIYLGPHGSKVENYVKIGDSIVKKANSEKIIVFKKKNNKWYGKEFK